MTETEKVDEVDHARDRHRNALRLSAGGTLSCVLLVSTGTTWLRGQRSPSDTHTLWGYADALESGWVPAAVLTMVCLLVGLSAVTAAGAVGPPVVHGALALLAGLTALSVVQFMATERYGYTVAYGAYLALACAIGLAVVHGSHPGRQA
ncbi:hypothetical protein EV193_101199 [Herbihabitans rhizosphaerae]|uniref:Uncharacterized protein n=1 Tax=Herbihabitans rhizosphaerae TaxID=1872711 RepID=A0A4Q7L4Z7_9PSEU|nr:hypothetical protein [Herbihabitans rhizosphaerae]RZS44324.1 hypothetical protein EV193_101199 [Herbihabitans rhizosphaerae]